MNDPYDQQLHQVHSTNAGIIPKLVHALAESGALPAGLATLLLQQAADALAKGPAQGDVVAAGVRNLRQTAEAIAALPTRSS